MYGYSQETNNARRQNLLNLECALILSKSLIDKVVTMGLIV